MDKNTSGRGRVLVHTKNKKTLGIDLIYMYSLHNQDVCSIILQFAYSKF